MKIFVCYALVAAVAIHYAGAASTSIANSGAISSSSSSSGASLNAESESEVQANPINQGLIDLTRLRKSAYGGGAPSGGYGGGSSAPASIPAPPCPKNYLFSCQPNLAPVPCSGTPSQGYGSAGAYSSPIASYVNPNYGHPHHQPIYAANPAAFLPQAFAYQY